MVVASFCMGRSLGPVDQLISVWKNWSSTRSAYHRLNELLKQIPRVKQGWPCRDRRPTIGGGSDGRAAGYLQFPSSKLGFCDWSGEVLGVVGPSGSGKSTLARLLVGIWPAAMGKVRLDDADVYYWKKDELGRSSAICRRISSSLAERLVRISRVLVRLIQKKW